MSHVTTATFDADVLGSHLPVVVHFGAPWCVPCRVIAPVLAELAGSFRDRVSFVAVDTDEDPGLVERFGIATLPTLHFYADGELVDVLCGARPKPLLGERVAALLAHH